MKQFDIAKRFFKQALYKRINLMNGHTDISTVLKRIDLLEQELATLKRDILHGSAARKTVKKVQPSLFGSVRGGDITVAMIADSKRKLFRDIKNPSNKTALS